jgi:hypothetical protein
MIFNIHSNEVDIGCYSICIETNNPTSQLSKGQRFVTNLRMDGVDDNVKLATSLRYLANMLEFRWETLDDK